MADNSTLVVVWELWDHLKTRLASSHMLALLGGGGIYVVGDDFSQPEGAETDAWGRLVIVPTATLWETPHAPNRTRGVGFLVRGEVHSPGRQTQYNAARALDAIQLEANARLQGYVPPLDSMERMMVALPIYMHTEPQPVPLWDAARGLSYTSAEYRTETARKPGA